MKVKSTMYYGETPIADCTWELDDRARTTQQALAAMSIEDHLRAQLEIKHEIVNEDEEEPSKKNESESESVNESEETDVSTTSPTFEVGHSCDSTIPSDEGGEHNGMGTETEVDEETSGRHTIPHPSLHSEGDD